MTTEPNASIEPNASMSEDEWYEAMRATLAVAEADVKGDMGDDAWETGGWADVTRSLIESADGPDAWKREALRMEGLEQRLTYLGEEPGTLDREDYL